MNVRVLSGLTFLIAVCGCSSSSSITEEDGFGSIGTGSSQTLRLVSKQTSYVDGSIDVVSYEYDQLGNLVGLVSGNTIINYNIDTDGKIISAVGSADGIPLQASKIYYYDGVGRLRRIDNLGSVEGVGVIGVSAFDLYKSENDLPTTLETRIIPFEEIVLNVQVDDSGGIIQTKTMFEYSEQRLIRELVDYDGDDVVDVQRDYTYNSDGSLASAFDTGASANSYVYSYEQGACNLNWGNATHRYFCVSGNGM